MSYLGVPRRIELKRYDEPILIPNKENWWESKAVFNPGTIYEDGKFFLLYRAVGEYENYISRFGLAVSEDGFNFKRVSNTPIFEGCKWYDRGGCEDARIVKIEGLFYITYASLPRSPAEVGPIKEILQKLKEDVYYPRLHVPSYTALLTSYDLREFERHGVITPLGIDDRDGILFPEKIDGEYVLLHRPTEWIGEIYGTSKPSIWIRFSKDLLKWYGERLLLKPEFPWEKRKIGGGPPPIKTNEGWLMFYHGVDEYYVYRVGAALLDLKDPTRVIARLPYPILEPKKEYEKYGDIPNVVFPTGNIVIDDDVFIYYGAADKVCCVATVNLDELLGELLRYSTL